MKTEKRIIEINGIKMEVDLRDVKVIDQYKVGDNLKVLVKSYGDNYESYIGTIIGFDNYEKTPTIVIAYLKTEYSSATIEFVYFNRETKDKLQICPLNDWDLPVTKSQVIDKFNTDIAKKEEELAETKQKLILFERLFGKYFEETKK